MNKTLMALGIIALVGCASQKMYSTKSKASEDVGPGDTRTKPVEYLDENTYFIVEMSDDKTYAYDQSNPVKVGGTMERSGALNERRYLNALLGPFGDEVKYFRAGSCCGFKTPNGFIDNVGLLDRYRVYWNGSKDTVDIYINMYDKGDLKVPVGLRAKKP